MVAAVDPGLSEIVFGDFDRIPEPNTLGVFASLQPEAFPGKPMANGTTIDTTGKRLETQFKRAEAGCSRIFSFNWAEQAHRPAVPARAVLLRCRFRPYSPLGWVMTVPTRSQSPSSAYS